MADLWQNAMDHAVAVARKAGEVVCEALRGDRAVMTKSSVVDLVTQTDQKVEQLIIQSVKEKFPTHRFIGEESVAAGEPCVLSDSPTWIIDPIDGTTNFVHAFPFVAVSIGFAINKQVQHQHCLLHLECFLEWTGGVAISELLVQRNIPTHALGNDGAPSAAASPAPDQVEFGVVFSCVEDKMFTARRGKGAFCNGEPLQVSRQEAVEQAMVATEFGSNRDADVVDKIFRSLQNVLCLPVHGVRGAGSAAINMCLVASGCVEAYYEIGIHVWDVAAASLIVSEAGGVLMDVEGGDADLMSRRIVAANSKRIAERLVKAIVPFSLPRDDAAPPKKS